MTKQKQPPQSLAGDELLDEAVKFVKKLNSLTDVVIARVGETSSPIRWGKKSLLERGVGIIGSLTGVKDSMINKAKEMEESLLGKPTITFTEYMNKK